MNQQTSKKGRAKRRATPRRYIGWHNNTAEVCHCLVFYQMYRVMWSGVDGKVDMWNRRW